MDQEQSERVVRQNRDRVILSYIRMKNRVQQIKVVAVRELPDPFYAASLECACEKRMCPLLKTGYIFDTDTEAIDFGNEWLKEIVRQKRD